MRKIVLISLIVILASIALINRADLSKTENRKLGQFPELTSAGVMNSGYFKQIENFYNDRFFLKTYLIKSKAALDYYVLGASPSKDVVIGKDGWLYYSKSLMNYKTRKCTKEDELQRRVKIEATARKLKQLEIILNDSGKRFLFVISPAKPTIYPEYLGYAKGSTKPECGRDYADYLIEALDYYDFNSLLYLKPHLMAVKNEQQVFYKYDTHWNFNGAEIASREILKRLSTEWDQLMPDMKFHDCIQKGDFSNMMALDLREKASCADIKHFSLINKTSKPNRAGRPEFTIKAQSDSRPLIPITVFFRDSFMDTPIEILKGSFSQMDTYWTNNIPPSEASEDLLNAEIVVFAITERLLEGLDIKTEKVERILHKDKL